MASNLADSRDKQLVEYDEFIETQLRRTRNHVRSVDIATALITLAGGSLVFVLLAALMDHWVLRHGLGFWGRLTLLLGYLAGAGYFVTTRVVPLVVRKINPLYAAHTIERSRPTLKNSLLNFLLFRGNPTGVSERMLAVMEEQAAHGLAGVPLESAVDRSRLIRLGYLLVGILMVCALYALFSPKNLFQTIGRVAMPWAEINPPTQTTIDEITPGNVQAFRGQQVTVQARVQGLPDSAQVFVYYTTADRQIVDRPVPMSVPADDYRHTAVLPAGDASLQQTLSYRIEAGDATAGPFTLEVAAAPTIVVQSIEYRYPAYTGLLAERVELQGDIKAIEGTQVSLEALANQPIGSAHLDFDCDQKLDLPMLAEAETAKASFTLSMAPDGSRGEHAAYQVTFKNREGHQNPQPVRHQIEVTRDLPPEVQFVAPRGEEVELPLDATLEIELAANDPDFALAAVTLLATSKGRRVVDEALVKETWRGQFGKKFAFSPQRLKLQAGDVVEYWAAATDNKDPRPNRTETGRRRIRIVSPIGKNGEPEQLANNDGQRKPGQGAADKEAADAKSQPRTKKPGEPDKPETSAEAAGEKNENNPSNDPADQPGSETEQPGEKSDNREGNSREENSASDGAGQGDKPEGASGGESSSGEQQQTERQEEVASDGSNDGDAIERILNHREQQQPGGDSGGDSSNSDGGKSGQQSESNPGSDEAGKSESGKDEQQPGKSGDQKPDQPGGKDAQNKNQPGDQQSGENNSQPGKQDGGEKSRSKDAPANQPSQKQQGKSSERPSSPPDKSDQPDSAGKGQDQAGKPSGEKPSPDKQAGEKQSGDKSTGENKPGDSKQGQSQKQPGQKQSGGNQSGKQQGGAGENSSGSAGEKSDGEKSAGEKSTGGEKSDSGSPMGDQPGAGQSGEHEQSGTPDGKPSDAQRDNQSSEGGADSPGGKQAPGEKPDGKQQGTGKPSDNRDVRSSAEDGQGQSKQPGEKQAGARDQANPDRQRGEGSDPERADPNGKQADESATEKNDRSQTTQDNNTPGDGAPKDQGTKGQGARSQDESGSKNGKQVPRDKQQNPDARGGDGQQQKGESGAGQQGNDNAGSPEPQENAQPKPKSPKQSSDEAQSGRQEKNQSPAQDKRESDSEGNDQGDKSGGGKQGGGQKANKSGTGGAGQNTSSDEGAGRSDEAGDGETSDRAGGDRKADGKSGQSGKEKGKGSKSRTGGGDKPGQSSEGNPNEPSSPDGKQQPGDANQSQNGKPGSSGGGNPENRGQPGEPPSEAPREQQFKPGEDHADAANLEYARKATDLALDHLKDQLAREQPDPELLDKLGWSKQDLEKFVERWEGLRKEAKTPGEKGQSAQRELDETLRSLGLKPKASSLKGNTARTDSGAGLKESRRTAPPAEYSEAFKAYTQGTARGGK